jgi:ribonuclease HI
MTRVILYTDGAARGNPGPAAIGVVLTDAKGNVVQELGEVIGRTTNNEAEYRALIRGLALAAEYGGEIEIRTDSELMARQLRCTYRVRAANLKPLFDQAQRALDGFKRATIVIVPRELNRRADALANAALDRSANANRPRSFA